METYQDSTLDPHRICQSFIKVDNMYNQLLCIVSLLVPRHLASPNISKLEQVVSCHGLLLATLLHLCFLSISFLDEPSRRYLLLWDFVCLFVLFL